MKEEDKIIDLLIDLGTGQKILQADVKGLQTAQQDTNKRLEKLEKQQAKTNLALGEMRLSYMNLDDKVSKLDDKVSKLDASFNKYAQRNDERVNNHEKRIVYLEKTRYGGEPYLLEEPKVDYKKKKQKKS